MTTEIASVAVLGGGIAGAAACLRLSALGLEPLWIAPMSEVGDRPGEHLAPAARPLLARLGALDLLERPYHRQANTVFSAWGSDQLAERSAIVHLEGPASVLDRAAFERDFVERARARCAGRVDATLAKAARRNGLWELDYGENVARARFLIDATGRAAVIARDHARRFRADRLAALYAFLDRDPDSDVEPTRATLIESTADGWWYAALLADDRLALNFFSDPDLLPTNVTRDATVFRALLKRTQYVGRWIDEADFRLESPPRLASAGTTWIAPAAGEGWVAIGDAAAAFDPLSSHGMTTALWTAIAAAEGMAALLSGDAKPLSEYALKIAAGVQEFLVSRVSVHAQEARFADRPFWQRRHGPDADPTPAPIEGAVRVRASEPKRGAP